MKKLKNCILDLESMGLPKYLISSYNKYKEGEEKRIHQDMEEDCHAFMRNQIGFVWDKIDSSSKINITRQIESAVSDFLMIVFP